MIAMRSWPCLEHTNKTIECVHKRFSVVLVLAAKNDR